VDNPWADSEDLARASQGTVSPLADAGYDPDELAANPAMRAQVMQQFSGQQSIGGVAPPRSARPAAQASPQDASQGGDAAVAPQLPTPSGISSASVSPSGSSGGNTTTQPQAPPATAGSLGLEALKRSMALGQQSTDIASQVANDPGPDLTALEADRTAHAMPTPYRDPQTGKVLDSAEQYKPGVGTRILRGIDAVRKGGVLAAFDPGSVGATPYGAPNQAYQTAEGVRQATLSSDDQQLKERMDAFKDRTAARSKAGTDLRAGATSYNDAAKNAAELQNADTRQTEADQKAKDAKDNSPEGAAALSQAQFDQRGKQADALHLRGANRDLYMANGKIPDPRQATSEEVARSQALQVFRQKNGRGPATMDELNEVNAAASGRLKGEGQDDPVGPIVADSTGKKQEFINNYARQADGTYLRNGADKFSVTQGDKLTGAQYNQMVDQFRLDANTKLARHGAQIDATGQVQRRGPATPTPVTPASGPPPGATHVYKDAKGNVAGYAVDGKYVAVGAQ
jgi:hypothetical protein